MVFPALRTFQDAFGSSTAWTTWVLTGFLVSGAVLTPILGRLGDQFGKERLLLISLGLFLAGCLGAAFAWNLWSLIAFRVVSGAGGALFPLSFAIIRDEFPPEKVKVGIGLLSAVWGVGGGFGIVLSGLIVDNFSWRYLFLLGSIPVALSLVLVARYVPESPIRSPSKVDVPGALLLSGGADLADGRADRGRAAGAGARRASSASSCFPPSSSCSGASSNRARARRWSTCACSRTGRSC